MLLTDYYFLSQPACPLTLELRARMPARNNSNFLNQLILNKQLLTLVNYASTHSNRFDNSKNRYLTEVFYLYLGLGHSPPSTKK